MEKGDGSPNRGTDLNEPLGLGRLRPDRLVDSTVDSGFRAHPHPGQLPCHGGSGGEHDRDSEPPQPERPPPSAPGRGDTGRTLVHHADSGSFDLDRARYLGVDIGGTSCSVCVGDAKARIVDRIAFATELGADGARRTIDELTAAARRLAARHQVAATGISCGGPLDAAAGTILTPPNLAGWEGTRIVSLFEQAIGVPASLENDANAGALAEWRFGAGRGADSLVYLTFSTGMGAGLILGGRLHRGADGLAGEVGHIRLADDGPVGYGKRGSFEGFCSGPALARLLAAELGFADERLTGRDVVERAYAGDAAALRAVVTSGERLGRGVAVLMDVLNPELIVVGGMGSRLGDLLLEPARRSAAAEAIPAAAATCRIVPAALGERIGDVAAICVALHSRA